MATSAGTVRRIGRTRVRPFDLRPGEEIRYHRRVMHRNNVMPTGVLTVTNERIAFVPGRSLLHNVGGKGWEVEVERIVDVRAERWKGNVTGNALFTATGLAGPIPGRALKTLNKAIWVVVVETDDGKRKYFSDLPFFASPTQFRKKNVESIVSGMRSAMAGGGITRTGTEIEQDGSMGGSDTSR